MVENNLHGGRTSGAKVVDARSSGRGSPQSGEQPEVNAPLSTINHRLMNAVTDLSDGTVWTTHAISVDWNADGDLTAAVRWYQLDPVRNEVVQSGVLGEPETAYFTPTVQANGDSVTLVYNVSGPDTDPGVDVAGRTDGFERGKLEDADIVKEGEPPSVPYQPLAPVEGSEGEFRPPDMRYGDYSGVSVDPGIGRYWSVAEYSPAYEPGPDAEPIGRFRDVWSTWIAESRSREGPRTERTRATTAPAQSPDTDVAGSGAENRL